MVTHVHRADINTTIGSCRAGIQTDVGCRVASDIYGRAVAALAGKKLAQMKITGQRIYKLGVGLNVAGAGQNGVDVVVIIVGRCGSAVDVMPEDVVFIQIARGGRPLQSPAAAAGGHAAIVNRIVSESLIAAAAGRDAVIVYIINKIIMDQVAAAGAFHEDGVSAGVVEDTIEHLVIAAVIEIDIAVIAGTVIVVGYFETVDDDVAEILNIKSYAQGAAAVQNDIAEGFVDN